MNYKFNQRWLFQLIRQPNVQNRRVINKIILKLRVILSNYFWCYLGEIHILKISLVPETMKIVMKRTTKIWTFLILLLLLKKKIQTLLGPLRKTESLKLIYREDIRFFFLFKIDNKSFCCKNCLFRKVINLWSKRFNIDRIY